MKNKEAKIFFGLIITVVVLFAIVVIFGDKVDKSSLPANAEAKTETTTEPETQELTVNFISVGDNLIHDGIYKQANKRAGGNGYDFSLCYSNVADLIKQADIATINQETVIAKSFEPSGYPTFNSPHEVGDEIVKIGFDVISLANNHMLDKGAKGMQENIEYWDSKTSVVHTGSYKNDEDVNKVEYIEKNGMKIGLVGITQYTNGLYLPKDSELRIIYTENEELIQKKITEAKKACDIVLVNIHWGNEYQTTPTDEQKALAKKMADWGADVIIGHHPHVLEPIEYIEKEDGTKTLCVYSLGNFISQQNKPSRVIGGMIKYTVTVEKPSGKVAISDVQFVPTVTHYVQGVEDVRIYQLSQYTDTLAAKQRGRLGSQSFSISYINNFLSGIIDKQFYDSGMIAEQEEPETTTQKETATAKETTTEQTAKKQTTTTEKATTTQPASEKEQTTQQEAQTTKAAA